MVKLYQEGNIKANQGRNDVEPWHFDGGSVANSQSTLISGIPVWDYDKHSVFVGLVDGGQAKSVNVQIWQSNASGATAPSGAIAQTNFWALVGSPIDVTSGTSAIKSWETTSSKFMAVTGSASNASSGGITVDLFLKSRH